MINQDKLKSIANENWANDLSIKSIDSPELLVVDVINQSIEMILTTIPVQRLFNLSFGSSFTLMVFNNIRSARSLDTVIDDLVQDIKRWEDRITIVESDIRMNVNPDNNTVMLTIPYIINRIRKRAQFSKIISN